MMEAKHTHGLTAGLMLVALVSSLSGPALAAEGAATSEAGMYEWAIWAGTNFGVGLALLWTLIASNLLYLRREYQRVVADNDRLLARCERLERLADSATGVTEKLVRS